MLTAHERNSSGRAQPPATIVDEPLVDRLLTPREVELRDRLRELVRDVVAPVALAHDHGSFAGDAVRALCAAGFGGLIFPVEFGGGEASTVAYAITIETVASVCPSTSLVLMTQMHAGYPLVLVGTEDQKRTWLPQLCSGSAFGALAITEPAAGSDVSAIRTTARRVRDEYVINGSKTFITTGDVADVIILFATVDRSAGRDAITAFILPGDAEGLSRGQVLEKLGMHGSSTAELFLDDVRLPASALLGEERGAWRLSMRTVVKSRISAASQGLGIATAAYALVLAHARREGLLTMASWQPQLEALTDLRTRILTARTLLYGVARAADEEPDRDHTVEVGMAKAACTDLGVNAAEIATAMLGARGDLAAHGAERLLRDVKITQIYDGTNEIQRMLIAREVSRRVRSIG